MRSKAETTICSEISRSKSYLFQYTTEDLARVYTIKRKKYTFGFGWKKYLKLFETPHRQFDLNVITGCTAENCKEMTSSYKSLANHHLQQLLLTISAVRVNSFCFFCFYDFLSSIRFEVLILFKSFKMQHSLFVFKIYRY